MNPFKWSAPLTPQQVAALQAEAAARARESETPGATAIVDLVAPPFPSDCGPAKLKYNPPIDQRSQVFNASDL